MIRKEIGKRKWFDKEWGEGKTPEEGVEEMEQNRERGICQEKEGVQGVVRRKEKRTKKKGKSKNKIKNVRSVETYKQIQKKEKHGE